ncbi:MAG: reverse transcriptase-like protein [Nitrososphaerales archaeon]
MTDIFADGAGYTNGTCAICVYIGDKKISKNKRRFLKVFYEEIPHDELEYLALIKAIEFAKLDAKIYSDSQPVVDEVNGVRPLSTRHSESYKKVKEGLNNKENIIIQWIPREKNLAGIYLDKRLATLKNTLKEMEHGRIAFKSQKAWKKNYYGKKRRHNR